MLGLPHKNGDEWGMVPMTLRKNQHFPKNPRGLEDNFHHEFLRVQIFDALELQNHTLPEPRQRMGITSTKKRGDHREWPNKIMCVDL